MSIGNLVGLVELRTKAASMIPFAIGTLYAVYRFESFDGLNFALMLVSLLCIDMATTAINNYFDYKKARKRSGYGYDIHNPVVSSRMNERAVLGAIAVLFLSATAAGIALVTQTDVVVLALGFVSFGIGILYSFGPIPISRLPFGELFSGLFMGFLIIFISVYIHVGEAALIGVAYAEGMLGISFHLREILYIFLVSIPAVCGIANIMLANNICDMEEDIENGRYTLPVFIGKRHALLLFRLLYVCSIADVAILYRLGVAPPVLLPIVLAYIPVRRKINRFAARPSKSGTFALAVQSFVLLCGVRILALGWTLLT